MARNAIPQGFIEVISNSSSLIIYNCEFKFMYLILPLK